MLNKPFKFFKHIIKTRFFQINQKIISQKYFIKRIKTKIIFSCLLLFWIIIFNKRENIKVAICTIGKNENLYVKEFNYILEKTILTIILN